MTSRLPCANRRSTSPAGRSEPTAARSCSARLRPGLSGRGSTSAWVLLSRPDGTRLHVGDVARVVDGFAETDQFARFDGHPAVMLSVFRSGAEGGDDPGRPRELDYIDRVNPTLPDGIALTVWQNGAVFIQNRPLADGMERPRRIRARAPDAGVVSRAAAGAVGQPGRSGLVPWRRHAHAVARRDDERTSRRSRSSWCSGFSSTTQSSSVKTSTRTRKRMARACAGRSKAHSRSRSPSSSPC